MVIWWTLYPFYVTWLINVHKLTVVISWALSLNLIIHYLSNLVEATVSWLYSLESLWIAGHNLRSERRVKAYIPVKFSMSQEKIWYVIGACCSDEAQTYFIFIFVWGRQSHLCDFMKNTFTVDLCWWSDFTTMWLDLTGFYSLIPVWSWL